MASTEQSYAPQSAGSGPPFRVLNVTPDGSQTPVDMEVVVLADAGGNITDDFRQTRRREELALLSQLDAGAIGMGRRHYERISVTDRRGNVERGTLR